jgi:hypothetical protein
MPHVWTEQGDKGIVDRKVMCDWHGPRMSRNIHLERILAEQIDDHLREIMESIIWHDFGDDDAGFWSLHREVIEGRACYFAKTDGEAAAAQLGYIGLNERISAWRELSPITKERFLRLGVRISRSPPPREVPPRPPWRMN